MYKAILFAAVANAFNELLLWPVSQNARTRAVALASYTEDNIITKNTVGFTCKDIWNDYTNLTKYYANDYLKVNRSVINVNCYFIVYFSLKSFYPHF